MHSSSADPSPQQQWLDDRRTDALAAFDARIPSRYSTPVALPGPVADWASGGIQQTGGLFLTGAIGVGKTHAAWTAARAWLNAALAATTSRRPVIEIWRSTTLFDELRPEGDDPRGLTRRCQQADLLLIDDLAAARVSPSGWTQERLYELFDERYVRERPLLITCDVLPRDLVQVVGSRVSSRLAEMCAGGVYRIDGPDLRKGGHQ